MSNTSATKAPVRTLDEWLKVGIDPRKATPLHEAQPDTPPGATASCTYCTDPTPAVWTDQNGNPAHLTCGPFEVDAPDCGHRWCTAHG